MYFKVSVTWVASSAENNRKGLGEAVSNVQAANDVIVDDQE